MMLQIRQISDVAFVRFCHAIHARYSFVSKLRSTIKQQMRRLFIPEARKLDQNSFRRPSAKSDKHRKNVHKTDP